MCNLLLKDVIFKWIDHCKKSFETIFNLLTFVPIKQSPNWSLPFELMCDASYYAVSAMLG